MAAERALAKLPRFLAVGQTVSLAVQGEMIVKRLAREPVEEKVAARDGHAELTLREAGWYEVSAAGVKALIFAYPKQGDMAEFSPRPTVAPAENDPDQQPEGWVNLAVYRDPFNSDDSDGTPSRFSPSEPVWALFEGHHAEAGGVLRLLLRVPSGPDRVVFTVEGRTIVDYHVAATTGVFQVVEIPVTERWLPNAYLQACPVTASIAEAAQAAVLQELRELAAAAQDEGDGSEDPRWCRVDVIDPKALPHGEELRVSVATDRAEYRPGDAVQVSMTVTGKDGQPREAEVALAAVDESLFTFGEARETLIAGQMAGSAPERRYMDKPWRRVGGVRAIQEAAARQLAQAMQQLAAADKAQAAAQNAQVAEALQAEAPRRLPEARLYQASDVLPSGEIPLPRLRQDFRETAAWLPQVRTDARGMATASFTLPDSLTRYRLTAVGLTRGTEIGSGRSSLRAALPLSTQVFLPRFAVEGDRLTAVGLIHNSTKTPRTIELRWQVRGAAVVSEELPAGWQRTEAGGEITVTARVESAAGEARVTLPLQFPKAGEVQVQLTIQGGADSDSERRTLAVQPWGRAREIVHRVVVDAEATYSLPEGFVPDSMVVSLSRQSAIELTDSLEGLRYLIDYPYGCVEQTMTRLMPAIVARDAVRKTAFALPPEVEAKLPDVIERGLARIYNFQHADGGWGWWEKDQTNDRMTVYVLYGLARCAAVGVPVNADCQRRGSKWLQERLAARTLDPTLTARAWQVLALAGAAERGALESAAEATLQEPQIKADRLTEMGLACLEAGLPNLANRLWQRARREPITGVASLALRLSGQFAFREPLEECYATAKALTALRQGYYFGSTWDTARAIDGLARIIPLVPPPVVKPGTQPYGVATLGANVLLDTRQKLELKSLGGAAAGMSLHQASRALGRHELAASGERTVQVKVQGGETYQFTLETKGWQRTETMEPVGEGVRLSRAYRTLKGEPLAESLGVGQVVEVVVTLDLAKAEEFVLVEDRRPAGCEYADDQIFDAAAGEAAHHEFRDDRVCAFFTRLAAGRHVFSYLLRAETPGMSHVPPGMAYPMYREKDRGETGSDVIRVEGKVRD